jgi:hypothetical protein
MLPNLCPYNTRKLQFRSKQCVFLDFRDMHKGFECLEVSTGRVYISRDVIFDENVFPFAFLHPNARACLRSEIINLSSDLFPTFFCSVGVQSGDNMTNDPTNITNHFVEENFVQQILVDTRQIYLMMRRTGVWSTSAWRICLWIVAPA